MSGDLRTRARSALTWAGIVVLGGLIVSFYSLLKVWAES